MLPATTCPHCGATLSAFSSCRERFDRALALEFSNPAYFAVHHLSVPCYLLQHEHYSCAEWLAACDLLRQFVEGHLTRPAARRRAAALVKKYKDASAGSNGQRREAEREIRWSRTIADVRLDSPTHYCADVRAWAAAVVADTEQQQELA